MLHRKNLVVWQDQPLSLCEGAALCIAHILDWVLNFSTSAILGQIILCYGVCPVYYRVFSSTPGLYRLDASRPPPQL